MDDEVPISLSESRLRSAVATAVVILVAACGGSGSDAGAAEAPEESGATTAEQTTEAPAAAESDGADVAREERAEAAGESTTPAQTETPRPRPKPKRAAPTTAAPPEDPAPTAADETVPEASTPPEAPPEPRMVRIEAGTELRATLGQEVSTAKNDPGDPFTATVASALVQGREVIVPEGAVLRGEITASEKSSKPGDPAALTLHFSAIEFDGERYPLSVTVTEVQPEMRARASTKKNAARIGGAAAGGAVLGRILGDGAKSTVIGGLAGAATGTAIIMATKDADAVLPAGSPVGLRLEEPLIVRAGER